MKKILSVILSLCMVFVFSGSTFATERNDKPTSSEVLFLDGTYYQFTYDFNAEYRTVNVVNLSNDEETKTIFNLTSGEVYVNGQLYTSVHVSPLDAEQTNSLNSGYTLLSYGSVSISWSQNTALATFLSILSAILSITGHDILAKIGNIASNLASTGGSGTATVYIYWTGAGSNPLIYWFHWYLDITAGTHYSLGWYDTYHIETIY